jgi:hypothetical protein
MVFKFRLISDEEKNFIRDVELLSDQTFYDFHLALTRNLNYDNSQIASFFISNDKWEKLSEITLFDMAQGALDKKLHVMDKTRLDEFIKDLKQRLLYVFDFFNERLLFVELIDIVEKNKEINYPHISLSKGNPPQQLLIDKNFEDPDLDE